MSRFFEEIEFEESKDPGHQTPKLLVVWDEEKLAAAWAEIKDEIEKIKVGASELHPRAVTPGQFGFPAENAMKIFLRDPSDKAFEGILAICRQDFAARAGDHFHELLKASRSEVPNE